MILSAARRARKSTSKIMRRSKTERGGPALIDPPRARPHSAALYVDRADPKLLHHRAYRSREDDAFRSIARSHGDYSRAGQAGPAPRFDGFGTRTRHHHQGA